MQLRPVSSESAQLLTRIHNECFPHYWNPDAFTDFFAVGGTCALLAEAGEPAGMVVYRVMHEQADIITIAVAPPFRRQGVARLLMGKVLADAAAAGGKAMFLDVEEGNEAALRLYKGYGFSQINRRKQYYRQKDGSFTDALVMMCKL
jgi:ribosomal-protein-alanine N-acetyltransferase